MITNDIIKKLEYINLDLNNIPEFIEKQEKLKYRPKKIQNEKNYKVYKFININEIEILITPQNRLTDILDRFKEATPLYDYLNEENIEKFTTFLKLLKQITIEDIEELENKQKELEKHIPLTIKFEKDYLWQIYYSEEEEKYFMLAPISESEYAELFYVLKRQLERKNKKIFVPICHSDYNGQILTKQEINDLEKALWMFTNNWASIYELFDKRNIMKLVITGKTKVLGNIESDYRLEFKNKEEAQAFYNLVQALSLLQTHYPHYYNFNIKVSNEGKLQFATKEKILNSDKIIEYVKEEYTKHLENITICKETKINLENQFKILKELSQKKQQEFFEKEKQIATYLECKKTFMGKVKYFFKYKKVKTPMKSIENVENPKKTASIKYFEKPQIKKIYTIQELLEITKELEEETINIKNMKLDIEGIETKIKILNKKIKNANLYIQEIDSHKKSIFDFWKFTSKDEANKLTEALETKQAKKIKKIFNLSLDLSDIGNELDEKVRSNLTKQEQDMVYLTTTPILQDINLLLNDEEIPEEHLIALKSELKNNKTNLALNILTGGEESNLLSTKPHRETAKNKFSILDIDETTTLEEYKIILKNVILQVDKAKEKIIIDMELPIYLLSKEDLPNGYALFSINPAEILNNIKEGEVNIYEIRINEKTKNIPLTNIVYFNNLNNTLPMGMYKGTKVLLNVSELELKLRETECNNIITFNNEKLQILKINIYKYDV